MSKIVWDKSGEHFFETGVDHGVLYPQKSDGTYDTGVAWNGLSSITEKPSGAESNPIYADNIKYLDLRSVEDYGLTIEAYTHPKEFYACNGYAEIAEGVTIGQQARQRFGISWRSRLGNEIKGDDYGYKLHIVYNCTAGVSEKQYQTVNNSPEAGTMSWDVTTTAIDPDGENGKRATASVTIDSTKVDSTKLTSFEAILYGGDNAEPRLPDLTEVIQHFS